MSKNNNETTRTRPLSSTLLGYLLITCCVFGISAYVIITHYGSKLLHAHFLEKVEASQHISQSLMLSDNTQQDIQRLERQLRFLLANGDIDSFSIQSEAPAISAANTQNKHPSHQTSFTVDGITVQTAYNTNNLNARITWLRRTSFVSIVLFNLSLIIIGFFLSRRVVRPIYELQTVARHIASQDKRRPIQLKTRIQEFSQLGQDLERMRASLNEHGLRMEHMSMHDDLTGLPNRRALYLKIDEELNKQHEGLNTFPFALLIIDVNNFKDINDVYGHNIGDEVLVEISKRINHTLNHNSEIICRLGGDEFAIFLKGKQEHQAMRTAERIYQALQEELALSTTRLRLGVSIGISLFPMHSDDRGDLLKKADIAMYISKREGKPFAVYQNEFGQKNEQMLLIRSSLRQALFNHEFYLVFQPKQSLLTGEISGFEALVRWTHPDQGKISPEVFIPMLEEMRLINLLTTQVIEHSLRHSQSWKERFPELTLAINLSPLNLLNDNLVYEIASCLEQADFPPHRLELEITENSIITESGKALQNLYSLHELGIKLSIDDFGTGYTSLNYLRDLPVDTLKIDRSFVSNMLQDEDNYQIVRATLSMAHHFKLQTVAEGVEDLDTIIELKNLGCELAQGYYISKPLMPASCDPFLEQHYHRIKGSTLIDASEETLTPTTPRANA